MAEELQQELLENPMLEESHEQDDFDLNNVSMEDFISGQGEEAKGKESDAAPARQPQPPRKPLAVDTEEE